MGSVTDIDFVGDEVEVTFELAKDSSRASPIKSGATLGSVSLLGEGAVDITAASGARPFPNGATSRPARTPGQLADVSEQGGRLLEQVLPRGNRIRYGYDGAGHVVLVTKGFIGSDTGLYDDGTWDDDCIPSSPGDTAVSLWSGGYGRDGTLDYFTDAQGAMTRILAKTGFGEPAVILEANGRITHRGYDQLGNVIWEAVYASGFDQPCAVQPQYAKPQLGAARLASMVEYAYDLERAPFHQGRLALRCPDWATDRRWPRDHPVRPRCRQ